jgi:hypothetical protein
MRQAMAIGLLCVGLAACTLPSPFPVPGLGTPPGDLTADRLACNRAYPPRFGNYLPHAQCVNAAVERDAIPYARYADLVRLQEQLRVKYSALIDQGAISPREGELRMGEVDGLVNAAMHERDVGRGGVADHRVDRLEAMLQ